MRRLLGTFLLCAALSACGPSTDQDADPGADHGADHDGQSSSAGSATPTPTSPTAPEDGASSTDAVVALLSASEVGGETTETAVALPDAEAVAAFVEPLDPRLGNRVVRAAAAADVPDDQVLHGQVVAVGCSVPETVEVTQQGADVVVVPRGGPKESQVQCLVPVTTVALVLADG